MSADFGRAEFLSKASVSHETLADLQIYADLLVKWQASINLVGPQTLPELWSRHFLDSLQVHKIVSQALRYVDLGSGAGFPGLVIALLLKGRPGAEVILVESNGKKAAFLQAVIRATGAPARVVHQRIEQALPTLPQPEVVTARALAPLLQLIDWCAPLLKSGAIGLFPKGRDLDKEVADAARCWEMTMEVIPSLVARDSSILKLLRVQPKAEASRR